MSIQHTGKLQSPLEFGQYLIYIDMIDVTLLTSFISVIATLFVLWNYSSNHKDTSDGILTLAIRLIVSDGVFSLMLLFWKLAATSKHYDNLDSYCRVFHPIIIFTLIAGYGWTVCIALKFKNIPLELSKSTQQSADVNYWRTWAVSFAVVLPIIILNSMGPSYAVSSAYYLSEGYGEAYCFFSYNKRADIVNNICFQLPLVLTIVLNVFAYSRGIYAIQNAPESVSNPYDHYLFYRKFEKSNCKQLSCHREGHCTANEKSRLVPFRFALCLGAQFRRKSLLRIRLSFGLRKENGRCYYGHLVFLPRVA